MDCFAVSLTLFRTNILYMHCIIYYVSVIIRSVNKSWNKQIKNNIKLNKWIIYIYIYISYSTCFIIFETMITNLFLSTRSTRLSSDVLITEHAAWRFVGPAGERTWSTGGRLVDGRGAPSERMSERAVAWAAGLMHGEKWAEGWKWDYRGKRAPLAASLVSATGSSVEQLRGSAEQRYRQRWNLNREVCGWRRSIRFPNYN